MHKSADRTRGEGPVSKRSPLCMDEMGGHSHISLPQGDADDCSCEAEAGDSREESDSSVEDLWLTGPGDGTSFVWFRGGNSPIGGLGAGPGS